ncbi:PepSY-like domain-containing protein [Flavobacterium sp. LS1R49]|uniref:PepSY-like domain-containing protein n=1 Tax=Flavobacterium shii TaxID=2987687 RepID=A0A9X2ZE37_9FLAO|nr:PepSY-like domain-containing protein [Flavobacterium shii]MCV9927171.1 PepSY-like domain-containing protein [Flavobacterium shii]
MKTLITTVFTILISAFAMAQDLDPKSVPGIVKSTILLKFPDATNVKWEKEKDNYEASFTIDNKKQSALVDSSGNLLQSEIQITAGQLPNGIIQYVKSNYRRKKVKDITKITEPTGKVYFEVEIYKKDLIFDHKGNFIKEVME